MYLFLSPWFYDLTGNRASAWNAWIGGGALAVLAIAAMVLTYTRRKREVMGAEILDAIFAAGAVWLFVSPWVLGFSAVTAAAWNVWIVGVAVAVISLFSVYDVQTHQLPQVA
ncbi:MAG TPA: SPW repeat protein [Actinomycetota bacterium]|nr:SPW repeat protein [Actinomycetota bacterium]